MSIPVICEHLLLPRLYGDNDMALQVKVQILVSGYLGPSLIVTLLPAR